MSEWIVKIVDGNGRVLRRFVAFARTAGRAASRGYEIAADMAEARDVLVCRA